MEQNGHEAAAVATVVWAIWVGHTQKSSSCRDLRRTPEALERVTAGCRVCTAQSRAGETDGVGTRRTVDSAFPNASQQSTRPRVTWAVVGGTEPAAAEVTTNHGGFTPRCAAECETCRSAKMPNCAGNNPSLMTRRGKTWDAVGSRAITTLTSLAPSLLFLRR